MPSDLQRCSEGWGVSKTHLLIAPPAPATRETPTISAPISRLIVWTPKEGGRIPRHMKLSKLTGGARQAPHVGATVLDMDLLTIEEVAIRLRVSRSVIHSLINEGSLRRIKVRHRSFITKGSLDAYLAEIYS